MYYSFWRNELVHFFIILNCEWFFLKSPHCLCLKIKFNYSGSSHQCSIIGKKVNIMLQHHLMMSTLFKKVIEPVFAIFVKFLIFFVFHVTLSVLLLKKWNFAVILTVNNKWVVKRLKFGSYCMMNCGETCNNIFP